MRALRAASIVLSGALVLGAAACGDGDADPEASPGDEEVAGFTEGDFDDVARLPDSEALDEPTRQDNGAIAATYLVRRGTPASVVTDLQERLEADGWNLVEGPTPAGDAVRADFTKERDRLEVSAFPASALEDGYESAVQYSLILLPDRDDSSTVGDGDS